MIDASKHHRPDSGPELIKAALDATGETQARLAERVGLGAKYLQHIKSGRVETISYTLQVTLELIANEKPRT